MRPTLQRLDLMEVLAIRSQPQEPIHLLLEFRSSAGVRRQEHMNLWHRIVEQRHIIRRRLQPANNSNNTEKLLATVTTIG